MQPRIGRAEIATAVLTMKSQIADLRQRVAKLEASRGGRPKKAQDAPDSDPKS